MAIKTRKGYTSKGQRHNVAVSTTKAVSMSRTPIEKMMNKVKAWKKGLNPWIVISSRGDKQRANDIWGDLKKMNRGITNKEN